jgi:NADPH-dependent 2,4-dienoyl-CoA reductase/sulfur reductase-like enzyme
VTPANLPIPAELPIAIVGNGGAAAEAVLALRANGYQDDIHLFADNDHPPYNPMLGTYLAGGKLPLERAFPFGDRCGFYEANRVTAHLNEAVVRLDAEAQELATAEDRTYRYRRCLVSSGARPAVPPIAGLREALAPSGLEARAWAWPARRVFTLQTLADALLLREAVDRILAVAGRRQSGGAAGGVGDPALGARGGPAGTPARAAVVGASFAGVKIAAVLLDLGFRVSLIERETSILPLAAHPEAARIMEAHLLAEGYELRLGAALAGVRIPETAGNPSGADAEAPARVRLDFGALPGAADPGGAGGTACDDSAPQEEVDLLVVCTGNRPALGFLAAGQVASGAGILVDEQMRSSIPTLYAAGDVAQGKNLLSGRHEIIGLWSNARYQGRAAGRSLASAPSGYPGGIPHNITHVGHMLFASMGCVDDYDKVTTIRDGDSWQIRLWREGRLVGLNLLDRCLSAGVMKQTFVRATVGATSDLEATWTSFNG